MAMTGSSGSDRIRGINVTPLIDVLLVLLIIFMVIVPVTSHGLSSSIPQPGEDATSDPVSAVVVQVVAGRGGEPQYQINQTPFAKAEIEGRLVSIFASRQERSMFVVADPSLEYASVAEVINIGHRASVDTIGLLKPGIERQR
jgi:biopolymer transport protein ExbD/biopolymer transport protein TolR